MRRGPTSAPAECWLVVCSLCGLLRRSQLVPLSGTQGGCGVSAPASSGVCRSIRSRRHRWESGSSFPGFARVPRLPHQRVGRTGASLPKRPPSGHCWLLSRTRMGAAQSFPWPFMLGSRPRSWLSLIWSSWWAGHGGRQQRWESWSTLQRPGRRARVEVPFAWRWKRSSNEETACTVAGMPASTAPAGRACFGLGAKPTCCACAGMIFLCLSELIRYGLGQNLPIGGSGHSHRHE